MDWLNREYGLDRENNQRFSRLISSGWIDIKQKTESKQKKIIITYNRKRIAILFIATLFFLAYVFLIASRDYFVFIIGFCILTPTEVGFFSKKTYIIKNISDNSIIIQKQSILKSETTIYKKEENPSLKLIFKDSLTDKFDLVIVSRNKMTTLGFIDSPFPFNNYGHYFTRHSTYEDNLRGHTLSFSKIEVGSISNFLDISISGKINSIKTEFADSK